MDRNELLKKLIEQEDLNKSDDAAIQEAQKQSNQRFSELMALKAGNTLGRALTQTQADPNFLADFTKRVDKPVEDAILNRKLNQEKAKAIVDRLNLAQGIEKFDLDKQAQLQNLTQSAERLGMEKGRFGREEQMFPLELQSKQQQLSQASERFGMDKDRFKREQELYPLEKQAKQLGLKKTEMDISQDVEANNPESDISKASIEIINEAMKDAGMKGVIAPGSMSYATISKIYPNIAYMIGNKFRSQERAEDREAKLEEKRAEKAKLSDKQISDLTNIDNTLDAISNIESIKPSMDTGIVSNLQNTAAQKLGVDDPKKSAFKALVQDQLAQYIKNISGAAVSDEERAFLLQNLPNTSDNDATFNAKLDAVKTRIAKNRERMLGNLKIQGKKTEEFVRNSQKDQPANDPRIDSFMKKNNITDKDEAIKILKEKGYIK